MPKAAWMLVAMFTLGLMGCGSGPTQSGPSQSSPTTTDATPDPGAARQGTLFIAGGGADPGHRLASAFLGLVRSTGEGQAQLLILPTASGVPVASGEGAAASFRRIATRHDVGVVPLDTTDPTRADDPILAKLIGSADGLWFTGGAQSRITEAFRPPGSHGIASATPDPGTREGPSLAYAALYHMLDAGGTVGGTSAGAAMMSDPMIAGGRSEQALLVGVQGGGVEVATGMGLYPAALLDQHFFERGRLGRLIVALEHTGGRWGLGIDEGKAIIATLGESPETLSLGPDSALLVDMAQATRDPRGNRAGIRLSLLGTGDRWGDTHQRVTPARDKERWDASRLPTHPQPLDPELGAWDPGAVRDALHALAADPDNPVVLRSRAFVLVFTADEHTAFYVRADDRRDLCAVGVRLDITRR